MKFKLIANNISSMEIITIKIFFLLKTSPKIPIVNKFENKKKAYLKFVISILKILIYRANNIKKPIIKENKAIASVKANPKIAILNNSSFKEGFRDIPITKAPNTVPIPTPAPAKPMVAKPAPTNFAD